MLGMESAGCGVMISGRKFCGRKRCYFSPVMYAMFVMFKFYIFVLDFLWFVICLVVLSGIACGLIPSCVKSQITTKFCGFPLIVWAFIMWWVGSASVLCCLLARAFPRSTQLTHQNCVFSWDYAWALWMFLFWFRLYILLWVEGPKALLTSQQPPPPPPTHTHLGEGT